MFKKLSPIFIFAIAIIAAGSAYAAPTPIAISGNPSCATLNASSNPAFAHITENYEFKVDPPVGGSFALVNASGKILGGGMTPNPNLFLSLAYSNDKTLTSWTLTPTASQFLDRLVSAVIVKGGPNGANVYPYNPLDNGDSGTFTVPGAGQAISHLSFCFELQTAPSAADAAVEGRVVDRSGRGIANAVVTIVNLNTGEQKMIRTNSFGNYGFKGLEVTNVFTLSVSAVRHRFKDPVRTFVLEDSLSEVTFSADR